MTEAEDEFEDQITRMDNLMPEVRPASKTKKEQRRSTLNQPLLP